MIRPAIQLLAFVLLFTLFLPPPLPARAGAEDLCLSVMQGEVRDEHSSYSEEETFNRYQSILRRANFRSYQEMRGQAGSLGLDLPMAEGIIGLSASAKTSDSTFRQEMEQFFNSTYAEARSRSVHASRSAVINEQLLRVVENCHTRYFETLKDRVQLRVEVDLNSHTSFTVSIQSYIPASLRQGLIIEQIEPSSLVTCTENGAPVNFTRERPSQQAVMECTKDANRSVALRIMTNAGTSNRIQLPSVPPPPDPNRPPPPPVVSTPNAEVVAVWSSTPHVGNPDGSVCQCLFVTGRSDVPQPILRTRVRVENFCSASVAIFAFREPQNPQYPQNIMFPPPPAPAPGREYTRVDLQPKQHTVLNFTERGGAFGSGTCAPS